MASKESDDKTVPTLVDVVVPGNTKVADPPRPEITSPTPGPPKQGPDQDRSPARAALKAKIEALVAEILIRHMDQARKEITHRVLSELDEYSVNTNEKQ